MRCENVFTAIRYHGRPHRKIVYLPHELAADLLRSRRPRIIKMSDTPTYRNLTRETYGQPKEHQNKVNNVFVFLPP